MPSAYNRHPELGYLGPSPILRRKAGFALPFVAFGAIAAASSMIVQMTDRTQVTDGRSTVVTVNVSDPPAAHIVPPPAIVGSAARPEPALPITAAASPDSIAEAAPSHPQVSATPTDSAQAAPVDPPDEVKAQAASVDPAEVTPTKPSASRAASRKSTRSAHNRRRDRGWYGAYAWRPYYWRASRYGYRYWRW